MFEKNKFVYTTLLIIKENIMHNNESLYDPIILTGLDKVKRYRIFWSIFNKEFNSKYKDLYSYVSCDKIDLEKTKSKRLIIIENIELLIGNKDLQNKLKKLLNICFEQKIQIIICSNNNIEDLEIDNSLKDKIMQGIVLYLKDVRE